MNKLLLERIRNIYRHRFLLWGMAISQLKSRYSGSNLGIWMAILNPLLIMLAISFVFTQIIKLEIKNFPLFALAGIFPWMFFSSSLTEAAFAIANQQKVLRQFKFPVEILPISVVMAGFLNSLVGWVVIYPLFVVFNPQVIFLAPLLVFILICTLIFVCGLAVMLAALNMFMRDLSQLLGIVLMFWFWITPVFYAADMIPAKFRWLSVINPVMPFIVAHRAILFNGCVPDLSAFGGIFFWTAASFIGGLIMFAGLESEILKRI